MGSLLLVARQGAQETWTLNDAATRNALSDALVQALQSACQRAARDASLRFVVLTGAGGTFCAGGSLGGFAEAIGQALPAGATDPLIAMNRRFGALLQALCSLPQVLLAVVDGPAMGGGLGLVCCADFVLASERAVLAAPEVTLGVVPAQITPFVLKRLGDRAARQCLLTGQRWSAEEARRLGLVDEVHAVESLPAAQSRLLGALSLAAPQALAATKQLLSAAGNQGSQGLAAVLDQAAMAFAQGLRSAEAAEGLSAFARKSKPEWTL
ncbi:MAG: enoyl-CoA hydratase/isomerase family protein [Polaromonas sp.]